MLHLRLCVEHRGKAAFLLKPNSKIKRSRKELNEVGDEEFKLKADKQQYLKEVKKLRKDKDSLNEDIIHLRNAEDKLEERYHQGVVDHNYNPF